MTAMQPIRLTREDGALLAPREAFYLSMPENHVKLEAEQKDDDGKTVRKGRFKMQVNSGIPMSHPWFGTLAVNLANVTWQGQHIAALLDHDTSKRVGYTTKLYVDSEQGLMAEGVMLSNDYASEVRKDSAEGFPFQASCYLAASKVLEVEVGAEHEVNGQKLTGPALVFEAAELREVTMCALGQDPNTSSDASLSDSDERIRIPLSVKVSTMTTSKEPTPAPTPAEPVVDTGAIALAAVNAEQERVTDILELAADCQILLAKDCIRQGKTALESAKLLSADLRTRDAAAAPTLKATALTTALSAPEPAPVAETPEASLSSLPEGEDKWRAQWAADPKVRQEFTDENTFLSYSRNKGNCSVFGSKSAFEGGSK